MCKKMTQKTQKLTFSALLAALCLILGFLESRFVLVPSVPGIRLGLSNVTVLLALCLVSPACAWCITVLKAVLGGLIFSGASGIPYAVCGGLCAMTVMLLLRSGGFSTVSVSAGGACAHTIGQLVCARFMLGTWSMLAYAPLLLLCSTLSGVLTGTAAHAAGQALSQVFPALHAHGSCKRTKNASS